MRNEDGRKVNRIKVGIVGAGGIGLASAAWAAHRGHGVSVWAPSGSANALRNEPLSATGALEATLAVGATDSAQALAAQMAGSEVVVLKHAPHGCNTSHADDFNLALLEFLKK